MRRHALSVLLAAALVALLALPAWAGLEKNPNVFVGTDLSCANGLTAESFFGVGRTGHVPDQGIGVATAIHVLAGPGGPVVATIFDVPGKGLDEVTTECEWFDPDLGAWIRGEIILQGNLR